MLAFMFIVIIIAAIIIVGVEGISGVKVLAGLWVVDGFTTASATFARFLSSIFLPFLV